MSKLSDVQLHDLIEAYDRAERHSVGLYDVATLAYELGYRDHVKRIESYPLGQQLKETRELLADAYAVEARQHAEITELKSRLGWAEMLLEPLQAEIARLDAKRSDPVDGEAKA